MTIEQSSCEFQQPLELFLGNDPGGRGQEEYRAAQGPAHRVPGVGIQQTVEGSGQWTVKEQLEVQILQLEEPMVAVQLEEQVDSVQLEEQVDSVQLEEQVNAVQLDEQVNSVQLEKQVDAVQLKEQVVGGCCAVRGTGGWCAVR